MPKLSLGCGKTCCGYWRQAAVFSGKGDAYNYINTLHHLGTLGRKYKLQKPAGAQVTEEWNNRLEAKWQPAFKSSDPEFLVRRASDLRNPPPPPAPPSMGPNIDGSPSYSAA